MLESLFILEFPIVLYFFILNLFYLFLLVCSYVTIFRRTKKIQSQRVDLLLSSEGLPHLTIIVPTYNEEKNIIFSIHSLLNLEYQNKTILIVNDHSTDSTLELLKQTFKLTHTHATEISSIKTKPIKQMYKSLLYDSLFVVDKVHGGKSDSINVGVNLAKGDYLLTIDADTLIDSIELNRLLRFSFTQPEIQGFGASVRVANDCEISLRHIERFKMPKSYLASVQAVEYLRAFYFGRIGYEWLGGPLIISGAFGLFRTQMIRKLEGYSPSMIGEDMDLVVRMKEVLYREKKNPRSGFIPEPASWTEVPENWGDLGKQRTRWHIGLIQVMWKYKNMLFNPKYGVTGLVSYPYFFFGEMLSPIVEAMGYTLLVLAFFMGINTPIFTLAFLSITIGVSLVFSISCCLLEVLFFKKYSSYKDIAKMAFYCLFENLGFRQATIWWRLKAFYDVFKTPSWQERRAKREGFSVAAVSEESI